MQSPAHIYTLDIHSQSALTQEEMLLLISSHETKLEKILGIEFDNLDYPALIEFIDKFTDYTKEFPELLFILDCDNSNDVVYDGLDYKLFCQNGEFYINVEQSYIECNFDKTLLKPLDTSKEGDDLLNVVPATKLLSTYEDWAETHHSVIEYIVLSDVDDDNAYLKGVRESKGRGGILELGIDLTNEFQAKYAEHDFDGDYEDLLIEFLESKIGLKDNLINEPAANVYVTNRKSYYFQVEQKIDIKKLKGCTVHDCLDDLYACVMNELDLERDEVEGVEMCIKDNKCYDDRAAFDLIDGSVENFISEYVQ
jgi:hypothetical protein